jgi:transposase
MADWQAIRAEYEQGASLRTLAAKHGVSKTYIIEKRNKEEWNRPDTDRPTAKQTPPNETSTPKKDLSTKDKQRLFLEAYAIHANVMLSAREVGIHRTTVYEWLEKDEPFSFAYNQAKEDAKDVIRAEIYRRGHDGVLEPVYQQGILIDTVRKYSDTLLIFHSKMLMPEYRDKSQVDVTANVTSSQAGTISLDTRNMSAEELQQLKALALSMRNREKA